MRAGGFMGGLRVASGVRYHQLGSGVNEGGSECHDFRERSASGGPQSTRELNRVERDLEL